MSWDPFDDLTDAQREQLDAYEEMLLHFNARINLISREDEDQVHWHVRHCLLLAYKSFPDRSVVVDWGTGGGLPAIPLAVRFPDVQFHAVDAVRKKVQAVRTIGRRLRLDNVEAHHVRAETWQLPHQYSVSRATAPLASLWEWHQRAAEQPVEVPSADVWSPGLLCLKGGELVGEIGELMHDHNAVHISRHPLAELAVGKGLTDKYLIAVHT